MIKITPLSTELVNSVFESTDIYHCSAFNPAGCADCLADDFEYVDVPAHPTQANRSKMLLDLPFITRSFFDEIEKKRFKR